MSKKSVDEYNKAHKKKLAQEKRRHEYEGWKRWRQTGRDEDLEPVVSSMNPMIQRQADKMLRGGGYGGYIPKQALEQQLRIAAVKGLKSYDPNRGTQLITHVYNQFPRVTDFVASGRNFARIPKGRMDRYQQFQNAQQELEGELHREPTDDELQSRLQWPNKRDVGRMRKEIRKDLYSDLGEDQQFGGSTQGSPSQIRSILGVMPSRFTAEERRIADAMFPASGDPKDVNSVARELGMPRSRVYRVRSRIQQKIGPYVKNI